MWAACGETHFHTPITYSPSISNEYCNREDHKIGNICIVPPDDAVLRNSDIFGLFLLLLTLVLFAYAKYWISGKKKTVFVNGKVDCSPCEMTLVESKDCGFFSSLCE